MRESDLRGPIATWYHAQGYECLFERLFPSGYCDVVAFRFEGQTSRRIPRLLEVIAVELKLADINTAIYQAVGYAMSGARAFVAMPRNRCTRMKPGTRERFRKAGVGLLAVDDGGVELLTDADYWPESKPFDWMQRKLWRGLKEDHHDEP